MSLAKALLFALLAAVTIAFYYSWWQELRRRGHLQRPTGYEGLVGFITDFLDTLGIPLLRGRAFAIDDGPGTALVTVVSKTLAERLFPGARAFAPRRGIEPRSTAWQAAIIPLDQERLCTCV